MNIRPTHTEADYKATLKEISALMESDPDLGTPEGDRLDILTTLVQAYEAKHVPITTPDPGEATKSRTDQSRPVRQGSRANHRQKQPRLRSSEPQAPADAGHDPPTAQRTGHPGRCADRPDGCGVIVER